MAHWAMDYIGKPWVSGADGPDAFNCWGLVVDIYRARYGRDLSIIPVNEGNLKQLIRSIDNHPERPHWRSVTADPRQEGDVALLRQSRHPIHVGIWVDVDGGGVLHSLEGVGVVFQRLDAMQLSGWKLENFYRHKDDHG